jgi:hypothetical protein
MYCAYSIRKNNYRLPFDCYCGVFSRRGSRHEASNIPEQGQTRPSFRGHPFAAILSRPSFRADNFAPLLFALFNLAYRLAYRLAYWLAYWLAFIPHQTAAIIAPCNRSR